MKIDINKLDTEKLPKFQPIKKKKHDVEPPTKKFASDKKNKPKRGTKP